MVILGIDPGLNHFGFGVIESVPSLRAKAWGEILINAKFSFEEKIAVIAKKFEEIFECHQPEAVAIEKIYLAKNTQIALNIGIATGVMAGTVLARGATIAFLAPGEIKKLVSGSGSATKDQIGFMVQTLLGIKESLPWDASDALAAAIGYYMNRDFYERIGLR
ncbi:MAG: crossover junction endodeoxyribonuclease RuvC [Candidatus Ratteibacteria bacterium]